jgi:carboxypeptidase family protein
MAHDRSPPNKGSSVKRHVLLGIAGSALVWSVVAVVPTGAQEVLGSIQGRVTDSSGAAVAGAHVELTGTAFIAATDVEGRWTMAHVPAGEYEVRVRAADGLVITEQMARVPAGGVARLDGHFPPVGEITTRQFVAGDLLARLPVDAPEQALPLTPGVVLRGGDIGIASSPDLAIRGTPLAQTSIYVDGAPARFETVGILGMPLAVNALDQLSVTTGVPAAPALDGAGGVINYITRSGGSRLSAWLRAESDEGFGDGVSVGYNRLEGTAGGPVPSVPHLTWLASATLQGQRSQYRGLGAAELPTYVPAGVDTVVQWTTSSGQDMSVALPRFVQTSGSCGSVGGTGSPLAQAMQNNYGFSCTGLRRPYDWSTIARGHVKFTYSYGAGSSLTLTGLIAGLEQRLFPGTDILDPALYQGAHTWSRLGVLNWTQRLGLVRRRSLTLSVSLSVGTDRQISGPLAPASEISTRDPALGIELDPLQFTGADIPPFPLSDQIIRNIRTNSGLRVPYLNRTDLRVAQPYRIDPYAMQSGWPSQGIDASLTIGSERRLTGRALLEWRPGGRHQITMGWDAQRNDISFYRVSSLISQIDQSAFLERPERYGVFGGDRIEVGSAAIDVAARYDHLSSGGEFATTPGFIFSNPAWNSLAATSDTAYANSIARVFARGRGHAVFSPRLRAVYSFTRGTSVRVAYGQQVNPIPFNVLFEGVNADLVFTNLSTSFGRDVDYVKSALAEVGVRHAVGSDLAVDLSLYLKTNLTPYAGRFEAFPNPLRPGSVVNVDALTTVAEDQGTGLDARIDWRRGDLASGSVSYALLGIPGTGGSAGLTTHALYATGELHLRNDWKHGTVVGSLVRNIGVAATFRATSGLPYTRLQNTGAGEVAPGTSGFAFAIEPTNSSHLLWTKSLDLRLTKTLQMAGYDWTVYADFRNLLNMRNTLGVYAETGRVTNDPYRTKLVSPELSGFAVEGQANGALLSDGSIDLHSCAIWNASDAARVNCVMLQRAEARFGNGDLVYSPAEQQRTMDAYFDAFFGPARFYGPGRTMRIGMALTF